MKGGRQMNETGTQDVSDREGKKRDLPGLRKVRATMSGIQGKEADRSPFWPSSQRENCQQV